MNFACFTGFTYTWRQYCPVWKMYCVRPNRHGTFYLVSSVVVGHGKFVMRLGLSWGKGTIKLQIFFSVYFLCPYFLQMNFYRPFNSPSLPLPENPFITTPIRYTLKILAVKIIEWNHTKREMIQKADFRQSTSPRYKKKELFRNPHRRNLSRLRHLSPLTRLWSPPPPKHTLKVTGVILFYRVGQCLMFLWVGCSR